MRGWGQLSLPFFFLCPPTAWPGRQTSLQEVPGRAGQQSSCLLARGPEKGGPGLGKHQGDCRHLRTFRNCWVHPWAGRRALTPNSPSQTLRTELQDGHQMAQCKTDPDSPAKALKTRGTTAQRKLAGTCSLNTAGQLQSPQDLSKTQSPII